MKHTLSINTPLSERLHHNPSSVSTEQVIDALRAYEAILDAINGSDLNSYIEATDDPSDVAKDINQAFNDAEKRAVESLVHNPYKDFFDDCVGALNGYWPGAGIEDEGLKSAILDAIEKGDTTD